MRYLLDTHAVVWFISGDEKLSGHARDLIDDEENELLLSIASLWEMAIKVSIGRMHLGKPFDELFPQQLECNHIDVLSISIDHVSQIVSMPFHHRDPFDRMIVAQALIEDVPIISKDAILDSYGVQREWRVPSTSH